MIPRRIVTCWMGRGKKSDLFEHCLASQRKNHPGWEFYEVNEDSEPALLNFPYVRAVLARGEYVKATELGRLWGLARLGGIYCDADVEVLRPMDDLLRAKFFIGREDAEHLNGAVMGSMPHGMAIEYLLNNFPTQSEGRESPHFYGPGYLTRMLTDSELPFDFVEHPPEVFYPSHWRTPTVMDRMTDKTVAHHRWAASWVKK